MEGVKGAASEGIHHGKEDGVKGNEKFLNPTPMLDELEKGPWPSFISGFKELAERTEKPMLRAKRYERFSGY